MPDVIDPLVLDLVEWLARHPRPRAEVIDAWRTSCPRLTIWEDAEDLGLIERYPGDMIAVTAKGLAHLRQHGRPHAVSR